ncbi:PepSY-associated TM helix domain-containing protein [Kushneria aurantia]|uniref:PepSY-associated TM helix domain-containing protein n=1 Tax=Kushneria aurantia TaxID=504092 RepID=A0ABV6G2I9_9GAMM|nr:PepSY-associated TM helix domain-containing protein [Kushneria aurantia]
MSRSSNDVRAPWLWPLVGRLHFYIGLLVGPFLLIAALSGILYALTPQIEQALYHHEFYTDDAEGTPLSLAAQVRLARDAHGGNAAPVAVRPASEPGQTTRVMFADDSLGQWENMAVFIDPVSGEVRGQLPVYGTSGISAFRIVIDKFHRGLLLGDVGRLYSELAASWLWIAALGGLALWFKRRASTARRLPAPNASRWHRRLGPWALIGFLFFSATGLTWSQYAGGNIGELRALYGWQTPSVSTRLDRPEPGAAGIHAGHGGSSAPVTADPAVFDRVLSAARAEGLSANKIEIIPASDAGSAWRVREIGREWPTEVDQAAIDPVSLAVIDRTRFEDFPLAAKLTRWGIDLHMGVLFGLINQLVLVVFASALVAMLVMGYVMWWRRRPTRTSAALTPLTLWQALARAPLAARLGVIVIAALIGWALPVLGGSLILLMAIDAGVGLYQRRQGSAQRQPAL